MFASTEKFTSVKIALFVLLTVLFGLAGCGHRSSGVALSDREVQINSWAVAIVGV
jgi:hypothetical protein